MPTVFSLPLSAAFAGQCLLIAGAFVAVILVLAERQRAEFSDAIHERIRLRQYNANQSILSPFLTHEPYFLHLQEKMLLRDDLVMNDSSTLESLTPFFEDVFSPIVFDNLVNNFIQIGRSSTFFQPNGDAFWFMGGASEDWWLVAVNNGMCVFSPQVAYPAQIDMSNLQIFPFDVTYDPMTMVREFNFTVWAGARAFLNPVTNSSTFSITISGPVRWDPITHDPVNILLMTINIAQLRSIFEGQRLSSSATSAILVEIPSQVVWMTTDASVPENDPTGESWLISNFPQKYQLAQYLEISSVCPHDSDCRFTTIAIGDDLVSLINIRTIKTNINLHLMQSTPRSFFFETSDRNRAIGIVIGALAAAIVVALCIWISVAIHLSLTRLGAAMSLAAVMQNEEAQAASGGLSFLSDVCHIQQSFLAMNSRLMAARPFLPQHLLLANVSGEDDDEEEEEREEEEDGAKSPASQGPAKKARDDDDDKASIATGSSFRRGVGVAGRGVSSTSASAKTSRAPSEASHTKRSAHHAVATSMNLLTTRRVGILTVNLLGFHQLVNGKGLISSTSQAVAAMCALVEACASAERGILDAFHGDHFTITFNVGRTIGNAGRSGALTATRLVRDFSERCPQILSRPQDQSLHQEKAPRQATVAPASFSVSVPANPSSSSSVPTPRHVRLSMGLSVGKAIVGNMGSDNIKKLCVVGSVYSEAVQLERFAKHLGQGCCVLQRAMDGIELVADSFLIGKVKLSRAGGSGGGKYEFVRAIMSHVNAAREGHHVAANQRAPVATQDNSAANEEWMYEMAQQNTFDPYKDLNEAVAVLLQAHASSSSPSTQEHAPPLSSEGDKQQQQHHHHQQSLETARAIASEKLQAAKQILKEQQILIVHTSGTAAHEAGRGEDDDAVAILSTIHAQQMAWAVARVEKLVSGDASLTFDVSTVTAFAQSF